MVLKACPVQNAWGVLGDNSAICRSAAEPLAIDTSGWKSVLSTCVGDMHMLAFNEVPAKLFERGIPQGAHPLFGRE